MEGKRKLIAVKIELDKDKVEREKKYNYKVLQERLDYVFKAFELKVAKSGELYVNLDDDDYQKADEKHTAAMYYLNKCKWFMDSVKTWLISYNFSDDKERSWGDILAAVKKSGLQQVVRYVE